MKKVKTGCRTCKIRKVKCDEGRPACQRCVSTGRSCDGYGIWGGGSQKAAARPAANGSLTRCLPPTLKLFSLDATDSHYFDWFKTKAAFKLPGSFKSNFWKSLLVQASLTDPAVLHAILALSAVSKLETIAYGGYDRLESAADTQDRFTVRHYTKALAHVRTHCAAQTKSSHRLALITCTVFVYLELLRGNFETAYAHYRHGLHILVQMEVVAHCADDVFRPERGELADDWIAEAFSRLHLQFAFVSYICSRPCSSLCFTEMKTPFGEFANINEAWRSLQCLFNQIFYLSNRASKHQGTTFFSEMPDPSLPAPFSRGPDLQAHIRLELARWLETYQRYQANPSDTEVGYIRNWYGLLTLYHDMASIMNETALRGDNECEFDKHTDACMSLLGQLNSIWQLGQPQKPANSCEPYKTMISTLPAHLVALTKSVVDVACIPPLFYLAVKCRVHRIRLQAIGMLESVSHREGIWDARASACIARKVMELEEGDFYASCNVDDDFNLLDLPSWDDLDLPLLPEGNRINALDFVLAGSPLDTIKLQCERRSPDLGAWTESWEYGMASQTWTDMGVDLKLAADTWTPSEVHEPDIAIETPSPPSGYDFNPDEATNPSSTPFDCAGLDDFTASFFDVSSWETAV